MFVNGKSGAIFTCACVCIILVFTACQKRVPAELILFNGKIFTARTPSEFVNSIAVRQGRIIDAGSDKDVLSKHRENSTRLIDLDRRLVLPGFHDAHLHMWNGAKIRGQLDFRAVSSRDSVLEMVSRAVKKAKPGSWILGRGWDHELWADKSLPDRRMLDRISTDHYIYLIRVDGHAAWVNTPVLQLLRYTRETPDPVGGKIVRYPRLGEPTGILIDEAFKIINRIIPEPTFSEKYQLLDNALQYAASLGITSVTDNSPLDIYPVYAKLYEDQKLRIRVNFWANYMDDLDSLGRFRARTGTFDEFLSLNLIKIYADGSLGSRSALLKKPYLNEAQNFGLSMHSLDELSAMVKNADRAGYQVGIHAIGDSAVSLVLDAYARVQAEDPQPGRRWRIEHAQVIDPPDFARFRELGVIASMQPSHCITDMHWAPGRIGDRTRYSYAWRSFLEHDVKLAFGTDWPVEPLNPLVGLYAAVIRKDTTGHPQQGWYPEERLTLGEAIRAYTFGSAFAVKKERWMGTLEPGRAADFIVLDRDLFTILPKDYLRTRVLATFVNGKAVYVKKGWKF